MPQHNFENALSGRPTPTKLRAVTKKLVRVMQTAEGRQDADYLCEVMDEVAEKMVEMNRGDIEVASSVGGLPTRYLAIDSLPQVAGGIVPGTPVDILSTPTVEVKIVTIRFDDAFAQDFTVGQLKVANIDLMLGSGRELPMSMFTTGICLPPTDAPILRAGSASSVRGVNNGGANRRFLGGFGVLELDGPC